MHAQRQRLGRKRLDRQETDEGQTSSQQQLGSRAYSDKGPIRHDLIQTDRRLDN